MRTQVSSKLKWDWSLLQSTSNSGVLREVALDGTSALRGLWRSRAWGDLPSGHYSTPVLELFGKQAVGSCRSDKPAAHIVPHCCQVLRSWSAIRGRNRKRCQISYQNNRLSSPGIYCLRSVSKSFRLAFVNSAQWLSSSNTWNIPDSAGWRHTYIKISASLCVMQG